MIEKGKTIMKFNKQLSLKISIRSVMHLVLIIGAFIMVAPFLYMIIGSFKYAQDIISLKFQLFSPRWTLYNWQYMFDLVPVLRGYLNSLIISISGTAIVIFTSTVGGFLLSKFRFKGRNALFYFILSTMMIPIYTSIIPLYYLIAKMHISSNYIGVIIPYIASAFSIFLMRQFISGIPDELIEAARIDGASDYRIFFTIIMPLAKSAIGIVGILTFLSIFNDFLWPLIAISKTEMATLPVVLARVSGQQEGSLYGANLAASSVAVIPILIVYAFFQKFIVKGITTTGMKV
jgi:multiple sugar transport system permease protein